MPVFFLHILSGDELTPDEEGMEFPDLPAAREEAIRGARGLMAAEVETGCLRLDQSILIDDADGNRVAEVAFGEALRIQWSEIAAQGASAPEGG
jgi:hypothetical protein